MSFERSWCVVFLLVAAGGVRSQGELPDQPTVADLVQRIEARERAAKTVSLRMSSRSVIPDGPAFETSGTLRVLGTTHFHVTMSMRFGDGMEGEHEVVRTPAGTWTRERNPIHGEVLTVMSAELMAEVEAASKLLGDDGGFGAVPSQSEAPLGSAMIKSIASRFDLRVQPAKLVEGGLDHYVLRGSKRPGEQAEPEGVPDPDTVEIVVRANPLEVVRMTHFAAGQEILALEIHDVQLDLPIPESSFAIDAAGGDFIDVMAHPPSAEQIRAILDEARMRREEMAGRTEGEQDAAAKSGAGKSKK